jgi:DnaJ-class molecular chaperone
MSDDPYDVLGVAKTVSQEDLRKAYRKLAKELHPDLNPGNADAEERFKTVTAAFDLLGDEDKRARYDMGEIDASGVERPPQRFYRQYADADASHPYASSAGYEDFGDVSDLFSDLFSRRAAGDRSPRGMHFKGQDVRYGLDVGFLEAVNGDQKRITLPDGRSLDVKIPAGVKNLQTIRLQGQGMPGMGEGKPGDALVQIRVANHPVFERDGNDIVMELPITIDEAVLGTKVEVPTATGRVSVTVPKGSSSGRMLRLKGRGVKYSGSTQNGDQRIRLKIVLPDEVDDDLARLMTNWKETHAYDPRTTLKEAS